MSGFIEGEDRSQATLFPERIDDYIIEDSAVRVTDVFEHEILIRPFLSCRMQGAGPG
jgi:hypothetical protein